MSGRSLILVLVLSTLVMSIFFYQALQKSPQYKDLVTEQMSTEFSTYTQTFSKVDRLPVAQTEGAQFFAPLTPAWKFIIHDKTLVAYVPKLESQPANQPLTPEAALAAKTSIQNSLLKWLEDKYHTKKDLLVDVQLTQE